jgi:phosphatidylserine synthase
MVNEQERRKQLVHFSLLRGYRLADLLTLANAFSGTVSILAMMSYLLTPERLCLISP